MTRPNSASDILPRDDGPPGSDGTGPDAEGLQDNDSGPLAPGDCAGFELLATHAFAPDAYADCATCGLPVSHPSHRRTA